MPEVTVDEKTGTLTVKINMVPHVSASGKSLVIATTHGNQPTPATYKGKAIVLGLNAYISNR